jgi:hypothetical protein
MNDINHTSDEKYIVFKRADWERMKIEQQHDGQYFCQLTEAESEQVPDAVVIRCQDSFAPPALDMYASNVSQVVEAFGDSAPKHIKRLKEIADYFHQRAAEAWQVERKLPD